MFNPIMVLYYLEQAPKSWYENIMQKGNWDKYKEDEGIFMSKQKLHLLKKFNISSLSKE